MKNLLTLSLAILFVTNVNAQLFGKKKVVGNGVIATEERITPEYESITVSGPYDVELVDGKEGQIMLKGDENILPFIETLVENGSLIVRTKKGSNLNSDLKIMISIPIGSISSLNLSGSGDFVTKKTIETDDFKARISGGKNVTLDISAKTVSTRASGSNTIQLTGTTSELDARLSGATHLDTYELNSNNTTIDSSGSCYAKVMASESFVARVSGSGNILYKGNPAKVKSRTSGSGTISKG